VRRKKISKGFYLSWWVLAHFSCTTENCISGIVHGKGEKEFKILISNLL
jgi:hypothetical protein